MNWLGRTKAARQVLEQFVSDFHVSNVKYYTMISHSFEGHEDGLTKAIMGLVMNHWQFDKILM